MFIISLYLFLLTFWPLFVTLSEAGIREQVSETFLPNGLKVILLEYFEEYPSLINSIASNDVLRAAKKYLHPEDCILSSCS